VLLSENLGGLGGRALELLVEGRLDVHNYESNVSEYIEGLEHVMYIKELSQKYDLGIVSTLPQYYLKAKLGIKTYSSVKHVLEDLLTKFGKNHKVMVLSDPDIILPKVRVNST
jgi:hypothetical protein